MRKPLIYLASPYSSGGTYEERYKQAFDATCKLMERGFNVFSPVVYSHLIAQAMPSMGCSWLSWQSFDIEMLSRCDELWQLCLPGWELSIGCEAERDWAFDRMPIKYIDATAQCFLLINIAVGALRVCDIIPNGDAYLIEREGDN